MEGILCIIDHALAQEIVSPISRTLISVDLPEADNGTG